MTTTKEIKTYEVVDDWTKNKAVWSQNIDRKTERNCIVPKIAIEWLHNAQKTFPEMTNQRSFFKIVSEALKIPFTDDMMVYSKEKPKTVNPTADNSSIEVIEFIKAFEANFKLKAGVKQPNREQTKALIDKNIKEAVNKEALYKHFNINEAVTPKFSFTL